MMKNASIYFKITIGKSSIQNRVVWAEKVFKNMKIFIQFNFSQINFGLCFSLTVLFLIENNIGNICVGKYWTACWKITYQLLDLLHH